MKHQPTICVLVDHQGHERYRGPADECCYVSRQLTRGASTWSLDGRLLQVRAPAECAERAASWIERYAVQPSGLVGETLPFEYVGSEPEREGIEEVCDVAASFLSGQAIEQPVPAPKRRRGRASPTGKVGAFTVWGRRELDILEEHYGRVTCEALMVMLPGRTAQAIHSYARSHGILIELPDGYESVTAAAHKRGFSPLMFRRVLRFAGVRPVMSKRGFFVSKSGRRRRMVKSDDADNAVKMFMQTESVEAAADRVGLYRKTLNRRLKFAGITPRKFGNYRRVTDAEVAKAMSLESRRDVAARFGVDPIVAEKAYKLAGIPKRGYEWLAFPEESNAAMAVWLARPKVIAKRKYWRDRNLKAAA